MGKCTVRADWFEKIDGNGHKVSTWGQKIGESEIFCKICACTVNIATKGFHAVLQHAQYTKHKKNCIDVFGPKQLHLAITPITDNPSINSGETKKTSNVTCGNISMYSKKDEATVAELIWVMKSVACNFSASSSDHIHDTFVAMFPTAVPEGFSLNRKKVRYLITDALAPYFQDSLLEEVASSYFSLSYDETTNVEDKKELQVRVRFWSETHHAVQSRHLQSMFLGRADGERLHQKILDCISGKNLPLTKLLMVASDGPNVNKKVQRLLNEDVIGVRQKGLINFGTCSIHTVHNAFQKGLCELGEDATELITLVHKFFDGWPSRCEEYEVIQEKIGAPMKKFVKHTSIRWLTAGPAASRLLEQWDAIHHYFLEYIPKEKKSLMSNVCCKMIISLLRRPAMKAETLFVMSSAELFTRFTKFFQNDQPLIHILYSELLLLLQSLMGRICNTNSITKVLKDPGVTISDKSFFDVASGNVVPIQDIVCNASVKDELSKLKQIDAQHFRNKMQKHFISACKYMVDKTPISSKALKSFRCLQPERRLSDRSCCDIIKAAKALPFDVPEDKLVDEWKLLMLESNLPDPSKINQIDHYWNHFFALKHATGDPKYPNITAVVKCILPLNHSNAEVERGFSQSRWTLTDDKASMSERTFDSIMTIKDALRQYNNCPHLVAITKKLIVLGQNAHKRYCQHLEAVRRAEEEKKQKEEEAEKLKKIMEEKQKSAAEEKKKISEIENILAEKRKEHDMARHTEHQLVEEATDRLKQALTMKDPQRALQEVRFAHALFESVKTLQKEEDVKRKEVDKLEKTVNKRKTTLITSFFNKKPRN